MRNVPDEVHRRLKSHAALAGMSMSEYVLREIEQLLYRPAREGSSPGLPSCLQ